MDRRAFLLAAGASMLPSMDPTRAAAQASAPETGPAVGYDDVVDLARRKSEEGFTRPAMRLRAPFDQLNYDQYRAVRMRREADPLQTYGSEFALDLLPPGFVYQNAVDISIVGGDQSRRTPFDAQWFEFDQNIFGEAGANLNPDEMSGLGYTGFRLRQAINRPDVLDEFVVFQGASYFRAIARRMIFGLSARGLAIRTADPRGEEFPIFTQFWVVAPNPKAREITVLALLESDSCSGAFEFRITPGETTVMETRCTLFPRVDISEIGIAPLTSMFFFGATRRVRVDDFRNAVHDSDGLQMIAGSGERIWRPLVNPELVQTSAFQDTSPKGFGLIQRRRNFRYYQDDEARYELRPSAWVEPLEDWGAGAVVLVEIPVDNEFNDNVVAFWRPAERLRPQPEGHQFAYRLHWCAEPPDAAPLARVAATRSGASIHSQNRRVMVVDFLGEGLAAQDATPMVLVAGEPAEHVTLRPLPEDNLMRLSFEFSPADRSEIEMKALLEGANGPLSETWLYRWSPR